VIATLSQRPPKRVARVNGQYWSVYHNPCKQWAFQWLIFCFSPQWKKGQRSLGGLGTIVIDMSNNNFDMNFQKKKFSHED
jgi:hypothetical protein